MPTITEKSEILNLVKEQDFIEHLLIESSDQYESMPAEFRDRFSEHYSSSFVDDASGVSLFTTPKKSAGYGGDQWGSWLEVSRSYFESKCPYTVTACEYAPWGVEIDMSVVDSFKTLGEALDAAFAIHQKGKIDLNVVLVNTKNGQRVRGEPEVESPQQIEISAEALQVNEFLGDLSKHRMAIAEARALENAILTEIHAKAWDSPIPLDLAKPMLEQLKTLHKIKIEGYTESMHVGASSLNTMLFGGKGKLLSYHHLELKHSPTDQYGTVLIALESAPGTFSFVSPEGDVFDNAKDARAYVSSILSRQYSSETAIQETMEWGIEPGLDFNDLSISEIEPMLIDDEYDPLDDVQWRFKNAAHLVSSEYRAELEAKVTAQVRGRDPKVPSAGFEP